MHTLSQTLKQSVLLQLQLWEVERIVDDVDVITRDDDDVPLDWKVVIAGLCMYTDQLIVTNNMKTVFLIKHCNLLLIPKCSADRALSFGYSESVSIVYGLRSSF